jgi:predicted pyridoxine 5'-phosphate oxidase superfamily flavin-nucleotide-binding protein
MMRHRAVFFDQGGLMKPVYHEGEIAVQTRAGVRDKSARIGKSIQPTIPPAAQEFLSSQPMAVLASIDQNEKVWASLLMGDPGFIRTTGERTIEIDALPVEGDPLRENLMVNPSIGMIVIEFATRRRMRINGTAEIGQDSKIHIHSHQVYANCPKYIQARTLEATATNSDLTTSVQLYSELNDSQQLIIRNADTFFIASHHFEGGADASHRGGNPGFIKVVNERSLIFPDYSGNTMFQTLGNLNVNPNCGLLFIDFETGSTLHITGTAKIIWDLERVQEFIGAERIIEFQVDDVIQISRSKNLRWQFNSYSPFNPKG